MECESGTERERTANDIVERLFRLTAGLKFRRHDTFVREFRVRLRSCGGGSRRSGFFRERKRQTIVGCTLCLLF